MVLRPHDFGEHRRDLRKTESERAEALNRIFGCAVVAWGSLIFAALVVGYWATH